MLVFHKNRLKKKRLDHLKSRSSLLDQKVNVKVKLQKPTVQMFVYNSFLLINPGIIFARGTGFSWTSMLFKILFTILYWFLLNGFCFSKYVQYVCLRDIIVSNMLCWYWWCMTITIILFFSGNDDNFSTDVSNCVHTRSEGGAYREFRPWWVVDLQDTVHVTHVTLTNRAGCCREYGSVQTDLLAIAIPKSR